MKPDQIKRLAQHYLDASLEEAEEGRLNGTMDDDEQEATELALTDLLEATQEQLQRNNFKKIEDEADELLQLHKLTLSKSSDAYRRLCREVLKAKQVFLKAELDRMDGKYWGKDSADYSTRAKTRSSPADSFSPESVRLFSAVLQDYFKHYEHRDQRTNHEKTVVFNRFMESIGGDKPVQDITKGECVRFRDTYSLLPKRISNQLRGKSMADVLAAMEGKDYVRVTKATVNLALDDVRHFFSWAIKLDVFTGKNPVDGIAYEGVKKKSYEMFTDEDLRKLFAAPEFLAQRTGRYPERYWLILILLHSGARREEIAQLRVDDVKKQDGIPYFDISATESDGKRLKNVQSRRRVPVHSALIKLGFFDYIKRRKEEGSTLLFPPSAKVKGRATPGDAVGKWFHRLRHDQGVTGRKPLHSFRHTVITRLAGAGVPQDIREIIVGHASDSVHGQTYMHRDAIPIKLLRDNLNKLDFGGCLRGLLSGGNYER